MNSRTESELIGRLFIQNSKIQIPLELGLKEKHFTDKRLGAVYSQMVKIYIEKNIIDVEEIKEDSDFIYDIIEKAPDYIDVDFRVNEIIEFYNENKLTRTFEKVFSRKDYSYQDKINHIMKTIEDVSNFEDSKNKIYDTKDLLSEWYTDLDTKSDIFPAPYPSLERYFEFDGGSLITIGARPAMGKTAFAINLVQLAAKKDWVMYINLEMSKRQIIDRMLSLESEVELQKIKDIKKSGFNLNHREKTLVNHAAGNISQLKLKILDCENPDFEKIIFQIKNSFLRNKFKIIVIDYLTLMHSKGHQSKNYEVEYMSNRLKLLAKELNTCIVVLAQLNRNVESKTDKRPNLSDLRDSGGIEQASNVVAFLHREDYYKTEKPPTVSELEVVIRKNRSGELGIAKLGYNKAIQKIKEKANG